MALVGVLSPATRGKGLWRMGSSVDVGPATGGLNGWLSRALGRRRPLRGNKAQISKFIKNVLWCHDIIFSICVHILSEKYQKSKGHEPERQKQGKIQPQTYRLLFVLKGTKIAPTH
jgi:hypothetical protein